MTECYVGCTVSISYETLWSRCTREMEKAVKWFQVAMDSPGTNQLVQFVDGRSTADHRDPTLHHDCDAKPHRTRYKKNHFEFNTFSELENKSVIDAVFAKQKLSCLSKVDLSKKGSLDEAVTDIVVFINCHDQYFTTSSCSGRIYIYEEVYVVKQILALSRLHMYYEYCYPWEWFRKEI